MIKKTYLIIVQTKEKTLYFGEDPVVASSITETVAGGISILAKRKTLNGAIKLRDKKYKEALVIEAW